MYKIVPKGILEILVGLQFPTKLILAISDPGLSPL